MDVLLVPVFVPPWSVAVMVIGWGTYFFHFQQVFVKHYGGVMSISVPKGQYHIAATWKEDHLWVENYDPATNTCHFNEYSKGNISRTAIRCVRE